MVVHEPVGVVAAVTPWNFPVDIAGIPVVYGLAVGCTVVWKPSEHAPLCAESSSSCSRRRLPAGHGQPRPRARRDRPELVRHPASPRSSSPARSRPASRSPGRRAENRVLELGGNGPADRARRRGSREGGRRRHRRLLLPRRPVLHRRRADPGARVVKDAFIESCCERTRALRVGDPLDDDTDMGPLCTPAVLAAHPRTSRTRLPRARSSARRRLRGPVPRSHRARRRDQRHADRAGGDVRPGGADHGASTRSTRRLRSPTRPSSGSRRRSSRVAARRLARGRGAAPRHRAHQRDHQLLGPAGAVRRGQEVRRRPRARRLDLRRDHRDKQITFELG